MASYTYFWMTFLIYPYFYVYKALDCCPNCNIWINRLHVKHFLLTNSLQLEQVFLWSMYEKNICTTHNFCWWSKANPEHFNKDLQLKSRITFKQILKVKEFYTADARAVHTNHVICDRLKNSWALIYTFYASVNQTPLFLKIMQNFILMQNT